MCAFEFKIFRESCITMTMPPAKNITLSAVNHPAVTAALPLRTRWRFTSQIKQTNKLCAAPRGDGGPEVIVHQH